MLNDVDMKKYIGTILIEHKIYQFVDQFNERNIYHKDFYLELLDNMSKGFVISYVLAASFFRLNPTIKSNYCGEYIPSHSSKYKFWDSLI